MSLDVPVTLSDTVDRKILIKIEEQIITLPL